ncbi:putative acetyltransferase [Pedobacter cryoconitis]|uniref:Putative acetyltransferase n=1 Tax=Pedobacter cryoconitis TaxID=188932 RepID=A0A7W8ZHW4_9SPHI|nr:GNAT family N-acetyltransferase [Pedobacter cryoconitis]MBB5634336.1 putative acetyltransferase [Pedobacter cryoconitis]MBB6272541.1 putative acetyltransferase [Pedobacter cryoconitis]
MAVLYQIDVPGEPEFPEMGEVWEASVKATHHFLSEQDIAFFKSLLLNEYFKLVELFCIRDKEGLIMGFMGIESDKLEMLFVHPQHMGKGIGKRLLEYALQVFKVNKVDVNEDNQQGLGFYEKMGFKITGRSELDGMGKPFPILHMTI